MIKQLTMAFACVVLTGAPALGQEPMNIEVLLKYGIYDETFVGSERYTFDQFRSILRESKAETVEAFEKEAANLGIDVPALVKLEFGGKSAKANFREWKHAFMNATSSDLLRHDKFMVYTRTVSPTLMQTVQKTIEARSHKVVAAWLVPSKDDLSFTLKLKFNPTANDQKAVIKAITILGPNETLIQPPGQDQRDLIKKGEQIPIEGVSVSFQRRDVRDTVTVTYNTTQGAGEVRVMGTDPNEAFDRLNRKLDSVEAKLVAAEGKMTANAKAIELLLSTGSRVDFKRVDVGITGRDKSVEQVVTFDEDVEKAEVVLSRIHLHYKNRDDHETEQIASTAEIVKVEGKTVTIKVSSWMHDAANNHAQHGGVTAVVIARLKSAVKK